MTKPDEYLVITPNLSIVTVIPLAYNKNGYLALGVDSDGNTYGNFDVAPLVGTTNTIRAAISLNKHPTVKDIQDIINFAVLHTQASTTL